MDLCSVTSSESPNECMAHRRSILYCKVIKIHVLSRGLFDIGNIDDKIRQVSSGRRREYPGISLKPGIVRTFKALLQRRWALKE